MKTRLILLGALVCASGMADVKQLIKTYNPRTLINGNEVDKATRPDIVTIRTGNGGCTASVVGPRVVVTASHCGSTGATSVFSTNGKQYSGKFYRSSLYPKQDHDVAVVVTSEDITLGGKPYSIVNTVPPKEGDKIYIYGYGCTQPGGSGGNDGKLRTGDAKVTGFSNYDMVLKGGAALCFGDSGGPAYLELGGGRMRQASVNSKGNIRDTSYVTRLDIDESRKFLEDIIATHKVDICGVNKPCDILTPPPPNLGFVTETKLGKITMEVKVKEDLEFAKRHIENLKMFFDSEKVEQLPSK